VSSMDEPVRHGMPLQAFMADTKDRTAFGSSDVDPESDFDPDKNNAQAEALDTYSSSQ